MRKRSIVDLVSTAIEAHELGSLEGEWSPPWRDGDDAAHDVAVCTLMERRRKGQGVSAAMRLDDALQAEAETEHVYDTSTLLATEDRIDGLDDSEGCAIVKAHLCDGMAFDDIGAVLGLTKQRCFQIYTVAMSKLKKRYK